ncbi:MAG TPA: RNA-binding S4 domain-containing protein [Arenicellales bacterium]|nr:RNA-binding S4 domain-containing protein [Arenicellales bacterium]
MSEPRVRIDKWLWAARFFKTRNLATEAVSGGKVHLNDGRVKPSRGVSVGDRLRIRKGELEFRIEVAALSERRGSAGAAATLYREDADSIAARAARRDERRLQHNAAPQPHGRPDKKARREWRRLTGK